jgi:hypothetical protein
MENEGVSSTPGGLKQRLKREVSRRVQCSMGTSQIRPFPAASAPPLEQKLQRKLENAGVSSSRNLAELPVCLHMVGIVEVHVVETR